MNEKSNQRKLRQLTSIYSLRAQNESDAADLSITPLAMTLQEKYHKGIGFPVLHCNNTTLVGDPEMVTAKSVTLVAR